MSIAASSVIHTSELMEIIVLAAQLALNLERAALVDPRVGTVEVAGGLL